MASPDNRGIIMARALSVITAIVAMLLVGGVAQASPDRYDVVGTWTLTNPAGSGGVIEPDMQDDYVEVSCEEGDLLRSYEINDRSFLSDEHIRYNGPGVLAYPDFTKVGSADTKILEIRITCRHA
jgi:hypothetical protein